MMRNHAVSQDKLDEIAHLKKLVNEYQVIGLAHLEKMPASALSKIRQGLRKDVVIHMAKKNLILRAFKDAGKPNLEEFSNQLTGISALLFTNMNPIKLTKYLESKATKGAAKPGDLAPDDIVVPEGDTKLPPGPVVSEFNQHLKVQTMVKNGTVHVKADTVTHKKGQVITEKAAGLLMRLGITPMTIKLDIYSAWEQGEIIPSEVLHINEEEMMGNVRLAASQSLNLALALGLVSSETVVPLIQKAARIAEGVAMKLPIVIPELAEKYVALATREAKVIQDTVPELEDSNK